MVFKYANKDSTEVHTQTFGPGAYIWQPRGTKHTFWPDEKIARFLVTLSSPELLDMFRKIGTKAEVKYGEIPAQPVPPTAEQLANFSNIATSQYGITIYPPCNKKGKFA